jgi:hypothetical protein
VLAANKQDIARRARAVTSVGRGIIPPGFHLPLHYPPDKDRGIVRRSGPPPQRRRDRTSQSPAMHADDLVIGRITDGFGSI